MMPLPEIKIASPCQERWEDMSGDERSRFCGRCEKQVYNFSTIHLQDVAKFIHEKEGRICARLYQRKDGTLLTENCHVGQERFWQRVKLACCSVIACILLMLGVWFTKAGQGSGARSSTKVEELWDEAVWKVKEMFGIQRPVLVMGEVCPAPGTAPVPPSVQN